MGVAKKTYFGLLTIILCWLLLEMVCLVTDVDTKSLRSTLYYQMGDLNVHRVSENPNLLYELRPGSSYSYDRVHPKENKYSSRKVSMNSLGFRDPERNKTKSPGAIRIIVFGGSHTYGAFVSDEDTYPQVMERILNENFTGNFEVWNAGVSAYVPSQEVESAKNAVKEFDPDILIFQFHNNGRRAFLPYTKFTGFFKKNQELYLENLPFLYSSNRFILKGHYFFVQYSRSYRFIVSNINSIIVRHFFKDGELIIPEAVGLLKNKYEVYGDSISIRSFENFIKDYGNITKIVICDPSGGYFCPPNRKSYEGLIYFELYSVDKSAEYFETHPPSYVYEWYAEELVKMLLKNNILENATTVN